MGMLYAEVDLSRIRGNLERLRELVHGASLLFVVKGDAYGHGLEEVAPATAELVDWLGVETLDEGLLIRSLGIEKTVLVMVPPSPDDLPEVVRMGFHFVLGDRSLIREAERAAARAGMPAFVHIPVDTGMGRYGFLPEELDGVLRELSYCVGVVPVGIYSHLSSAHGASPEDIAFTRAQIDLFLEVIARLERRGVRFPWVHLANSPGLLSFPETSSPPFNLVRGGSAAYGYVDGFWREWGLRPAARVWTEVAAVRELPRGWPVGYERRHVTARESRVAILGVGYRHGLTEGLRGAWVEGELAPLIGKIGMDSAALDVTGIPRVRRGSEALLFDGTGENIEGWALPTLVPMLSRAEKIWKRAPVEAGARKA